MIYVLLILFIAQIAVIFVTTRSVTNKLFIIFHRRTRSEFASSWLLGLVYLPGTLLHELSHFLTAIALLLPVGELSLLPEIKKLDEHGKYYVKLGHVTFGHKDYLRTSLVGIAPLIVGLAFFYSIFAFNVFPSENIFINILGAYVLFAVSSSMFSSKKDMEGTLIFIPLAILIISLMIGFRVNIFELMLSPQLQTLMLRLNIYLVYGSLSNAILFLWLSRVK
jgi:hypothetical protein